MPLRHDIDIALVGSVSHVTEAARNQTSLSKDAGQYASRREKHGTGVTLVSRQCSVSQTQLQCQAIGSLKAEVSSLQGEIDGLLKNMNDAIKSSNQFVADIKQ